MTTYNLENFWEICSQPAFDTLAFKTFYFQYENNKVYRSFCDLINCNPAEVTALKDIPYLPISFFKSNGEARRALAENSISVNKIKVDESYNIGTADLIDDQYILLQRGKKNYFIVEAVS